MKKLFALLLVILTILPLSLSAAAAEDEATLPEVLYATPTIDGQLDEAYTKSASMSLDVATASKLWNGDNGGKTSDAKVTTYLLWDKTYLYICSVVTDSTVVNTGIKDGWKADAAEYWIKYLGTVGKIAVDAFGTVYIDRSQITTSMCQAKATRTDTGYITELAIPKLTFKDGDVINFSLQLNDFFDVEGVTGICAGNQKATDEIVLVARTPDGEIVHDQTTPPATEPPVITTPEETEPPVVTTPEETEPVVTTPEETEPVVTVPATTEAPEDTEESDKFPVIPVVIGAIVVIVVAVVIILKKKK